MNQSDHTESPAVAALRRTLKLVRRRWVTFVVAVVAVVGGTVLSLVTATPRYRATAEVILSRQNLANSLNNISDPGSVTSDYARVAQTQAEVAQSPNVLRAALTRVGLRGYTVKQFQQDSDVRAKSSSDILEFTVSSTSRANAIALTRAFSAAYIDYRRTLDTASIRRALDEVEARIRELRAASGSPSLLRSLESSAQRLRTLEALQISNAYVITPPDRAGQISPRPKLATALALLLGLIAGLGAVFARNALDTRTRTSENLTEHLAVPVLGELPPPPTPGATLTMLGTPHSLAGESIRTLRANVELANVSVGARTIAVTSAVAAEGKSTTASELAVALARSNRRVALVDLDLRSPSVHEFFHVPMDQGVTSVALGHYTLDEAMRSIDLDVGGAEDGHRMGSLNQGTLHVLTSGARPPDPGEFIGSPRVREMLARLADDYDVVLIDTPPVTAVGDVLAMAGFIDAFVLVGRLGKVTTPALRETRTRLTRTATPILGVVATNADAREIGYGYGYGYEPSVPVTLAHGN